MDLIRTSIYRPIAVVSAVLMTVMFGQASISSIIFARKRFGFLPPRPNRA